MKKEETVTISVESYNKLHKASIQLEIMTSEYKDKRLKLENEYSEKLNEVKNMLSIIAKSDSSILWKRTFVDKRYGNYDVTYGLLDTNESIIEMTKHYEDEIKTIKKENEELIEKNDNLYNKILAVNAELKEYKAKDEEYKKYLSSNFFQRIFNFKV